MDLNMLFENYALLMDSPNSTAKIRELILQLAVQGKLAPQDPTDEPAGELLKRIKSEKEKLITEGKIRKQKPFPPITEDEIPYELPQDWEWVRLGELSTFLGGYAFKSHTYVKSSKNQVIRLGNVKNSGLLLDQNPVFVSDDIANDKKEYLLEEGDLLITMTGTRAKRDYLFVTLVKNYHLNRINLYLNQRVGCLRFFEPLYIELFEKFLKADNLLDNLFSIKDF